MLERFGTVRETLQVGFGADLFQVNLLDTIVFEPTINDREYSAYSEWIVKECDPGQDTVTIEGLRVGYILSFDGVAAKLDTGAWQVFDVN